MGTGSVGFVFFSRQILTVGGVMTIRSSPSRAMSPPRVWVNSMSWLMASLTSSRLFSASGLTFSIKMLPDLTSCLTVSTSSNTRRGNALRYTFSERLMMGISVAGFSSVSFAASGVVVGCVGSEGSVVSLMGVCLYFRKTFPMTSPNLGTQFNSVSIFP